MLNGIFDDNNNKNIYYNMYTFSQYTYSIYLRQWRKKNRNNTTVVTNISVYINKM